MRFILLYWLALSLTAHADSNKITDLPWVKSAMQMKPGAINICGDRSMRLTTSSIKKHFLDGQRQRGYFLSKLISYDSYREILKTKTKEEAASAIKSVLTNTELWQVKNEIVQSLGTPKLIEIPFSATIKDCVEGAKTTLGMSCNRVDKKEREACCSEKFVGPVLVWETKDGTFKLFYSPDPSVQLKVPTEKNRRYCYVMDSIN